MSFCVVRKNLTLYWHPSRSEFCCPVTVLVSRDLDAAMANHTPVWHYVEGGVHPFNCTDNALAPQPLTGTLRENRDYQTASDYYAQFDQEGLGVPLVL